MRVLYDEYGTQSTTFCFVLIKSKTFTKKEVFLAQKVVDLASLFIYYEQNSVA